MTRQQEQEIRELNERLDRQRGTQRVHLLIMLTLVVFVCFAVVLHRQLELNSCVAQYSNCTQEVKDGLVRLGESMIHVKSNSKNILIAPRTGKGA